MAMYAKVRRMKYRDGLSVSEIARRTSLSRNTIKTWLREPVRSEMAYRREDRPKKLDGFVAWLRQALETDARRPRKERRTANRLFAQLQAEGFSGSYCRVTEAIRAWRAEAGAVTARSAYVPLRFEWGEAFQFDWSEEGIVIGGVWRKVQLAHMKLCASRAFWLVAYPSQSHEMLFDAHLRCLTGLGGVARRGIYDNMKTAVDRVPGRGKARIVNARFAAMTAHYLIDPDFCNVASGWEKGRVEKGVQDSRRRIWQSALDERFSSFAELNVWLATQCIAARSAAHPDYPGMTIGEALEHEQPHLMPVPAPFDGYIESPARVSSTCLVTAARNRYSVPCAYAGHRVSVRLYPERVVVVADQEIVAEHPRATDRDHDSTLIEGIGRGFHWQRVLDVGLMASASDIARAEGLHHSVVCEFLRLTLMAPDIITTVMAGRQPRRMSLIWFQRRPLPVDWEEQRAIVRAFEEGA